MEHMEVFQQSISEIERSSGLTMNAVHKSKNDNETGIELQTIAEEGNVIHASNENNSETTIEMQNITEEIIIKQDIIRTMSVASKENEESISCSLNLTQYLSQ
eukprot:83010_1